MPRSNRNSPLFWLVALTVLVLDIITKWIAVGALVPQYRVIPVIGTTFQFRLVYNPGAAFGLYLGPYSRWIFLALTVGALFILWKLYRETIVGDSTRVLALALVSAGAVGNLIDRVRSPRGVVDFIDIGVGDFRWPTFNIADMAVSIGAFLLAWVLWGEETRAASGAAAASARAAEPK